MAAAYLVDDRLDEAIAYVNARPSPLVAYWFGPDDADFRTFVPGEPEPAQIMQQRGGVFLVAAHRVGILQAQQEYAARAARESAHM